MGPLQIQYWLTFSFLYHEENWLNKCPIEFKTSFYTRYLDDIFVLVFLNHLNLPARFANLCPLNIRTKTSSLNRKMLALFRFQMSKFVVKNDKLVISVNRRPTCSKRFTNYESFIPTYQKKGLLHTLLHQSFSIYCNFKTFHFETNHLKNVLIKTITPLISQIRALNHFLISYLGQKLWFRMHQKEMLL